MELIIFDRTHQNEKQEKLLVFMLTGSKNINNLNININRSPCLVYYINKELSWHQREKFIPSSFQFTWPMLFDRIIIERKQKAIETTTKRKIKKKNGLKWNGKAFNHEREKRKNENDTKKERKYQGKVGSKQ